MGLSFVVYIVLSFHISSDFPMVLLCYVVHLRLLELSLKVVLLEFNEVKQYVELYVSKRHIFAWTVFYLHVQSLWQPIGYKCHSPCQYQTSNMTDKILEFWMIRTQNQGFKVKPCFSLKGMLEF
jgi:hypothetical protein